MNCNNFLGLEVVNDFDIIDPDPNHELVPLTRVTLGKYIIVSDFKMFVFKNI